LSRIGRGKSDEELIAEAESLHNSIFNSDCGGYRDVRRYELICKELARRGYKADQVSRIVFVKVK